MDEERDYAMRAGFLPALRELKERSGDRLTLDIDETSYGTLEVEVDRKPPGEMQWTTHVDAPTIVLTHAQDGATSVNLEVHRNPRELKPVTNDRAADLLDVDLKSWMDSRDIIETGLSQVAQSMATQPDQYDAVHDAERIAQSVREEQSNRNGHQAGAASGLSPTKPNNVLSSDFPKSAAPTHHSPAARPYIPPQTSDPNRGIGR